MASLIFSLCYHCIIDLIIFVVSTSCNRCVDKLQSFGDGVVSGFDNSRSVEK